LHVSVAFPEQIRQNTGCKIYIGILTAQVEVQTLYITETDDEIKIEI
jgi:hypothetical protein